MIDYKITELFSRIDAMREQEEKTVACHNYFPRTKDPQPVDEMCRQAMADWCFKIVDIFTLNRETVGIAMSFLDRYLSSDNGKSSEALESRHKFQLAAITAFFIAVKVYEPVEMGVDFFVKLCRGCYSVSDVLSMEQDILFSLEWRVSKPTPLDFVRHLLELLPESTNSTIPDLLLRNIRDQMDYAATDMYFSTRKPSVVGVACLTNCLSETSALSVPGKNNFWLQVSNLLDIDVSSEEVLEAQQRLLLRSTYCKPSTSSCKQSACSQINIVPPSTSTISSYYYGANGESSSSPVCVSKMASQEVTSFKYFCNMGLNFLMG